LRVLSRRLDVLGDGPFARIATLLDGVPPNSLKTVLDLSLGEPRHAFPDFVGVILEKNRALLGRYPPLRGTPEFCSAAADWLIRRYRLPQDFVDPDRHLVILSGSREGLFLIPQVVVPDPGSHTRAAVLIPNPYYPAYAGAAVSAGADPVFVDADPDQGHMPNYSGVGEETLARTVLCYVCSPANPQGSMAGADYLEGLIRLARKHDFLLAVDECYADIYDDTPPVGALEVCAKNGLGLENLVVFHSLSKRSSVPGLRSGFVAGDERVIDAFIQLRAYAAASVSLPVQAASAALWADDAHVEDARQSYREKFDLAERELAGKFDFYRPQAAIFLWLRTGDSETAAMELWRNASLKVMPGSYLGNGENHPGNDYVRLAMVTDMNSTADALQRINSTLS
jgi:aspartate/methionine/tyrosine aminotransferase